MGGDKRLLVPGVGQPSDGQAGSVIIAFKPRVTPIPKDDHDAENKRMRLLLPNARLTTKVSFERAKQRIKKLGSSLSFDRKSNKIMQPAQVDRLFELARKNDVQQMIENTRSSRAFRAVGGRMRREQTLSSCRGMATRTDAAEGSGERTRKDGWN